MKTFSYHQPTRIRFGRGTSAEIGTAAAEFGERALLVTVPAFPEIEPIYAKVRVALEEAGLAVAHFDGVIPNPTTDVIAEGAQLARAHRADVVAATKAFFEAHAGAIGALDARRAAVEEDAKAAAAAAGGAAHFVDTLKVFQAKHRAEIDALDAKKAAFFGARGLRLPPRMPKLLLPQPRHRRMLRRRPRLPP